MAINFRARPPPSKAVISSCENLAPRNDECDVLSRARSQNSLPGACILKASEQLYHRPREAIPGHSSLGAAARYRDGRIELASRARSGAERARGPMFISWAVTSYQSNGARCDFSQGISVCLIEIPYPDPPGLPGLSYANGHRHTPSTPPFPRNSHASRSSLHPRFFTRPIRSPSSVVYALVRFGPSLRLVRCIRSARRSSISPGFVFVYTFLSRVSSSSLFPLRRFARKCIRLSGSLQVTGLNIAFCPTYLCADRN